MADGVSDAEIAPGPGDTTNKLLLDGEPIRFVLGDRPREAPELRYRGRVVATQPSLANEDLTNAAELSGAVAVAQRGDCAMHEKTNRAAAAGAVAMLLVDTDNDLDTPYTEEPWPIPVLMVPASAAEALLESQGELALTLESGARVAEIAEKCGLVEKMMENGEWRAVLASVESDERLVFHEGDYRYYLLHLAACCGAPLDVFQTLVEANPAPLSKGSGSGTPLDNARTNDAVPEVLWYLGNYASLLEAAQRRDWNALKASQRAAPASWVMELATAHGAEPVILDELRAIGELTMALSKKDWGAFGTEPYQRLEYLEDQPVAVGMRVTHEGREAAVTAVGIDDNDGKVKLEWADDKSSSDWIEVDSVEVVNELLDKLPVKLAPLLCTALEHSGQRLPLDAAIESDDTPPFVFERLIDTSGGIEAILDADMRTSRTIMLGSKWERYRLFAESWGTFLGRYKIIGVVKHRSGTCLVIFAEDLQKDHMLVALKLMHNKDEWLREQEMRKTADGGMLDAKHVVPLLEAVELDEDAGAMDIRLKGDSDCCFLLTMPQAEHDLSDVLSHYHVAGRDQGQVTEIMYQVAEHLKYLNEECGLAHGDIKPRNLIQVTVKTDSGSSLVWVVIDLDASCTMGSTAGQKVTSSAYWSPEMARQQLIMSGGTVVLEADLVKASVQLEMWAFGVMLCQLCTEDGETLWHANQSDNIDDAQLRQLAHQWPKVKAAKIQKLVWSQAAHLADWLLQENPMRRPSSWDQVMRHPFLSSQAGPATHKRLVMSCPEDGTLHPSGEPPYNQPVMEKVSELQQIGYVKLGFDRAGTSTAMKNDEELFEQAFALRAESKHDEAKALLMKTDWWYGYKVSVKQAVKLESQSFGGVLDVTCIKGGFITQLEAAEMQQIMSEAEQDCLKSGITVRYVITEVSYYEFLSEYEPVSLEELDHGMARTVSKIMHGHVGDAAAENDLRAQLAQARAELVAKDAELAALRALLPSEGVPPA